MKPLIVGEQNPYGSDAHFALYPRPEGSAGWRLCHKVLGLSEDEYLGNFDRCNLCDGRWDTWDARLSARTIVFVRPVAVLLGRKVASVFDLKKAQLFTTERRGKCRLIILPHPSGRCRVWNDPTSFERARELLRAEGVMR